MKSRSPIDEAPASGDPARWRDRRLSPVERADALIPMARVERPASIPHAVEEVRG
jgi:beta-xylosidase